jgi:hypothetical protein
METLSERWELGECPFLRTVILPSWLEVIPDRCFWGCYELASVNLIECGHLRDIGEWAFDCCVSLGMVELPDKVEEIGFDGSGLRSLVVDNAAVTSVSVCACADLERLVLPARKGTLYCGECLSLRRVTVGEVELGAEPGFASFQEFRFRSVACPQMLTGKLTVAVREAVVIAEVSAVGGRVGCPLLPQ